MLRGGETSERSRRSIQSEERERKYTMNGYHLTVSSETHRRQNNSHQDRTIQTMRDPRNIVLRVRKPGPSQDPNPESHTHRKIRPRQGSTRTHAYYIILLSQINEAFPDKQTTNQFLQQTYLRNAASHKGATRSKLVHTSMG